MRKGTSVVLVAALAGLLFIQSCETLDQITRTLMSLRRLQFKLDGVHDFSLLGINFSGKSAGQSSSSFGMLPPLSAIFCSNVGTH